MHSRTLEAVSGSPESDNRDLSRDVRRQGSSGLSALAEERSLAEERLLHSCSGQDTVSVSVGEKGTEALLCGVRVCKASTELG